MLCSSARRARETWDLASATLRAAPALDVRPSLYLAPPQAVLTQLRDLTADVRVVAVVGHEPTQTALVELLAAAAEPRALRQLAEGFRTSAVARLTVEAEWAALGPGACRLTDFAVPRA